MKTKVPFRTSKRELDILNKKLFIQVASRVVKQRKRHNRREQQYIRKL